MKDPIFKAHPRMESYHKTSDGECFYTASDAKNHAKSLKDKAVEEVKRVHQIEVTAVEEVGGQEVSGEQISTTEVTGDAAAGSDEGQAAEEATGEAADQDETADETGSDSAGTEAAANSTIQHQMASDEGMTDELKAAAEKKALLIAKAAATRAKNKAAKAAQPKNQ